MARLFHKGDDAILKKIGEEATETVMAARTRAPPACRTRPRARWSTKWPTCGSTPWCCWRASACPGRRGARTGAPRRPVGAGREGEPVAIRPTARPTPLVARRAARRPALAPHNKEKDAHEQRIQRRVLPSGAQLDSLRKLLHILYALYAIFWLTGGITALVAIIVDYVKRDDARGSLYASHFARQIRSFWWSIARAVLGGALFFTVVLIPAAFAVWGVLSLWMLYRIVRAGST